MIVFTVLSSLFINFGFAKQSVELATAPTMSVSIPSSSSEQAHQAWQALVDHAQDNPLDLNDPAFFEEFLQQRNVSAEEVMAAAFDSGDTTIIEVEEILNHGQRTAALTHGVAALFGCVTGALFSYSVTKTTLDHDMGTWESRMIGTSSGLGHGAVAGAGVSSMLHVFTLGHVTAGMVGAVACSAASSETAISIKRPSGSIFRRQKRQYKY